MLTDLLTMTAVNQELFPLIRMTASKKWHNQPIYEWKTDKKLFNSVILLFGVFPVDLHFFNMTNVSPNGFQENSSSLINKHWKHKRTIDTDEQIITIIDEVNFKARLPFIDIILKPVYKQIFFHRHRKLAKA